VPMEPVSPMDPVRFAQIVAFPQIPTEDMPSTQKRRRVENKQTKVRNVQPTPRPDSSPTGAPTMLLPTATHVIVHPPASTVVLQCPSADIYAVEFNSVDTTKLGNKQSCGQS
jgi:hypothetical protein